MNDTRAVLVDECPDALVDALGRRGLTTETCADRGDVLSLLDAGVGGVVVRGALDAESASDVRDRVGVVPVFFLTESPSESAHDGGVIATSDPETPEAVASVVVRAGRAIGFTQWALAGRNSDSLYRTVVEQSHDAIFVAQDGEFRFWNRRLTELTGLRDGELTERSVLSIVHPDDCGRAAAITTTRRQGVDAPASYEIHLVDADGVTHECSTSIREVDYHGSDAVLVSMRDMTGQRATEVQFRGLVELARDPVILVGIDGRIKYQSPSVTEMLGFDEGELVGGHVADLIHPDDWDRVKTVFEYTLQTGADGTDPVRYCQWNAEGLWMWFESMECNQADTSAGDFVVTSRNMTEQRSYKQRLKRYETIVKRIGQGVYVLDEAGVVQFINEATPSWMTIPMSMLVGRHISTLRDTDHLVVDQYERAQSTLDAVLGGESERERFEIELSFPEKNYVAKFTVSPIVGGGGEIAGVVDISVDMTERERYEQWLNALHVSTRRLTGATSREEVAEIVREAATEVLDYAINDVLPYDESQDVLVPTASTDEARDVSGDVPPIL